MFTRKNSSSHPLLKIGTAFAMLAALVSPFALSSLSPETASAAGDTVKIMPVGDSITFGYGDDGGYRKYLDVNLKEKNISFDMVGPEGPATASFNYNGRQVTYDNNHAGYSGFQIKEEPSWAQQQGTTGSLYNKLKSNNAVKSCQPDIILLIIGTNDMTANRSMDACSKDLHDLVDYMLADMPADGMIFMGSIPEFTAYGGNAQRIANYNSTVKSVAEDYQSKGKNVQFADVHGCLNGTADLGFDNLHPNGTGYQKIGKFWSEVIEDYLKNSTPQTTTVTTTTTTTTEGSEPRHPAGAQRHRAAGHREGSPTAICQRQAHAFGPDPLPLPSQRHLCPG